MFDHHQAEITVMQFTGHSLPVHQSMRVPWDFLPCPISSAKPANTISFDYWPLECVTSFRCITLKWLGKKTGGELNKEEKRNVTTKLCGLNSFYSNIKLKEVRKKEARSDEQNGLRQSSKRVRTCLTCGVPEV